MSWQLLVDNEVRKQLQKIPRPEADRLSLAMEGMAVDPFIGDIEKMRGEENVWRRRVGSYRIFYEVLKEQKIIYINDLKRRASNTYWFVLKLNHYGRA